MSRVGSDIGCRRVWRSRLLWSVVAVSSVLLVMIMTRSYCVYRIRTDVARHHFESAKWWIGISQWLFLSREPFVMAEARMARLQGDSGTFLTLLANANSLGIEPQAISFEQDLMLAQSGALASVESRLKSMLTMPDTDHSAICEAMINGYLVNYRINQAAELLVAWEADYPELATPQGIRGQIEEQLGNVALSVAAYEKAIRLDPERVDIELRLTIALVHQHRFAEALTHFQSSRLKGLNSPEYKLRLAECLIQLGRTEEARTLLQPLVVEAHPPREVVLEYARLLVASGEFESAYGMIRSQLDKSPDDYDFRHLMVSALRGLGRSDEIADHVKFLDSANSAMDSIRVQIDEVRSNPDDVERRLRIGRELMRWGQPTEATTWLKSVIQLQPTCQEARELLATHYERIGELELARFYRQEHRASQDELP